MKVGLLGGTFDPVHLGHIKLARQALRELKLNRVYFVVAPRPPHKSSQTLTSIFHRIQMVHLGLKGQNKFSIALWEVKRKGSTRTIDTLRWYKKRHPHDEIFFILGSDALNGFNGWKSPREILKLVTLVVGRRPGTKLKKFPASFIARCHFLKGKFPPVSSSTIRTRHIKGQSLSGWLSQPVVRYIKENKLYGTSVQR